MDKIWKAKWVIDQSFYGKTPINIFHKEYAEVEKVEHESHLKDYHMMTRKVFTVDSIGEHAYLDISADDYYIVYINGKYVGQGPAPSYYFHYYYNRYDVGEFLHDGENVIAVHTYYQGLINRVWNSGDYRQGLIAEMTIDNELILATDQTWKAKRALEYGGTETIGYETQFLEHIDNRLKEKAWKELSYDDREWENVCVHISDDHKLYLQPTAPLEVYTIQPEKIEKLGVGHYLIDYGQEITGTFTMTASGEAGQEVTVMCGEELLDEENRVRYDMRCNCVYKEVWTLSGENDVLEHFDYKAFRYVEVIAEEVLVEDFSAVVRHHPYDEQSCQMYSSNTMLNDVWKICKNGVKYGTQEVYVDCPTREKGQYLGDITIVAHAHLYLTGDTAYVKKSLEDFARSSVICPGLMAVAPGSFMQEIADYSLQFPYQILNYYNHTGDIAFLKEMYPIAEGVIHYFKKYERPDGLLENVKEKWNLVDWPENLRDNYDFELSRPVSDGCHNVINAFYCGAIGNINEMRDILEVPYDVSHYEKVRKAYIGAFYNRETKLFVDSTVSEHSALHSNIVPLFWGIVPDEVISNVVDLIKQKGLSCGVYNAYFLLKGLANVGEYNLIYQLIVSDDIHSWGNMVNEGATTCFEAWGKDQKWNTSLCHPWASAPIPVLIEDILGVKPASAGWKKVQFTPNIPNNLKHISLKFETNKGTIKVEHINRETKIEVPEGCVVI